MDDVAERKHALARSRSPAVADRERLDALFVRLHRRTIFTLNSYAEEQLGLVHAEGCVEIQGFLISRPVPAAEAHTLMRRAARMAA